MSDEQRMSDLEKRVAALAKDVAELKEDQEEEEEALIHVLANVFASNGALCDLPPNLGPPPE